MFFVHFQVNPFLIIILGPIDLSYMRSPSQKNYNFSIKQKYVIRPHFHISLRRKQMSVAWVSTKYNKMPTIPVCLRLRIHVRTNRVHKTTYLYNPLCGLLTLISMRSPVRFPSRAIQILRFFQFSDRKVVQGE